jgi:hypothetical protein
MPLVTTMIYSSVSVRGNANESESVNDYVIVSVSYWSWSWRHENAHSEPRRSSEKSGVVSESVFVRHGSDVSVRGNENENEREYNDRSRMMRRTRRSM